jgi:hypothetical protein
MFLTIAIISLSLAAFLDGWQTNRAVQKFGAHESDKIAAWIFSSVRPTPRAVYLRGGLVIAGESTLALILSHALGHSWPHVGIVLAVLLCAQAGMHFYEFCRTLRMY